MTWSLDYSLGPERAATLTELNTADMTRWDGRGPATGYGATEPRLVRAGAQFTGGPGREREAAEAWAFEMTAYFKRGVGGQPEVTYRPSVLPGRPGTYTVTGLIQTTHPGDHPRADGIMWFT